MRGFVGGSKSAWAGIERLEPGSLLEWSRGDAPQLKSWWTAPVNGPSPPPQQGEVLEYLDRAVSQRLVSDVPLGGFLSGGVDSAGVACRDGKWVHDSCPQAPPGRLGDKKQWGRSGRAM